MTGTKKKSICKVITLHLDFFFLNNSALISVMSLCSVCMHHSDPAGRNVHLSTEHNFSGKSTILIGKRTCTAAFFCNMLD